MRDINDVAAEILEATDSDTNLSYYEIAEKIVHDITSEGYVIIPKHQLNDIKREAETIRDRNYWPEGSWLGSMVDGIIRLASIQAAEIGRMMSNNEDYIRVSNVLHAANDDGLLTADEFRAALESLQRLLNQAEKIGKE